MHLESKNSIRFDFLVEKPLTIAAGTAGDTSTEEGEAGPLAVSHSSLVATAGCCAAGANVQKN